MKERESNIQSFTDMDMWKRARKLRIKISKLTKTLPKEEKYRLVDQLIRSSRSVTANIAEGYGRFHYQENIQFFRRARGSLYEVFDPLICAFDEGYLESELINEFKEEITSCIQLINGFISYLRKAKQEDAVNESVSFYKAEYSNNE